MSNLNLAIKNYQEYEETLSKLEDSIRKMEDVYDSQIKNTEVINKTDTWTGEAQSAMYDKLRTLNGNYEPIKSSLELYIKFLHKTKEDYRLMMEAQKANMDSFAEDLTVNS